MAINKIVPQYLNKSSDQRIVKAVEMTHAENVHLNSDEGGNAGVVKTIKGNAYIGARIPADRLKLSDSYTVVGALSIPKKQVVIYFVHASTNSDGAIDCIYSYEVENDNYRLLMESDLLNFQDNKIVHADVVFNDVDEALVYFTDGHNPPRKFNLERLIADRGDIWAAPDNLNYYSDEDRLEFLEVCKTPPTYPILFEYQTNDSYLQNNLIDKTFQFAYQYVYKDGEVSALSTYSKLAINPNTYGTGIVNSGYHKLNNEIVLTYRSGNKEVVKIKLMMRINNGNEFYIIDEVDNPSTPTAEYTFRNDNSYGLLASSEIVKTYDNVPQKANAQAISGSRLMYADYTEGYNNLTVDVESSVVYHDVVDPGLLTASYVQPTNGGPAHIIINGTDLEDSYSPGAIITLRVNLNGGTPGRYQIRKSSAGYLFDGSVLYNGNTYFFGLGEYNNDFSYIDVPYNVSESKVFEALIVASTTMSKDDVLDEITSQFLKTTTQTFSHYASAFNAAGEVTAANGPAFQVGATVYASLDLNGTLEYSQDTSYSVAGKRKIDIDIATLTATIDMVGGYRDVNIAGTQTNDSNTAFPYNIDTSTLYYKETSGVGVSVIANYAYEAGVSSFKTNAIHNFGIVYYDKKGRASGVQKIDGVYVGGYADPARQNKTGRVDVRLKLKHDPPSWADHYQIVYGGNETISDFLQYTVAGAHYLTADATTNEAQDSIYLDLMPLEGKPGSYKNDKGANLEYTFKEGDILRIISYYNASQTREFLDGYEYKVLGKKVVTDETEVTPNRASTFVVIKDEDYSTKDVDDFNLIDVKADNDKWGQKVMVEIYSPNRINNDVVYYEIGERYPILNGYHIGDTTNNGYPVVVLNDGDVYFKPREILVAPFDQGTSLYDEDNYENFEYDALYVESVSSNDYFDSSFTSKGRAHGYTEEARQIRRRSSVTYSDPYSADTSVLRLSSFNLSQGNWQDYDPRHGKIDKLLDKTDRLFIFQEHKVGFAGVNRNLLQTLSGGDVVVSQNVLGVPSYYSGDFGSSGYPAAIVERFGIIFYVDVKAQKVIRLSNDGLTPISDVNMDSFFNEKFSTYLNQSGRTEFDIVAGYDPDNDEYVITQKSVGSMNGWTVAFDAQSKVWTSLYSFIPDMYANINDEFISFLGSAQADGNQEAVWLHEAGLNYGQFYGTYYPARVEVMANINPSLVKTFDTISIEGTHAWGASFETSDQATSISTAEYSEREREFFASIPRDENISTSNYITIGQVLSIDNQEVTFSGKVNQQPVPLGASVYEYDGNSFVDTGARVENIKASNKIVFDSPMAAVGVNNTLVVVLPAKEEGDKLRDYYCKVSLSNTTHSEKVELFAINVGLSKSFLHNDLGQEVVNQ